MATKGKKEKGIVDSKCKTSKLMQINHPENKKSVGKGEEKLN